jgi:hypothetical protein
MKLTHEDVEESNGLITNSPHASSASATNSSSCLTIRVPCCDIVIYKPKLILSRTRLYCTKRICFVCFCLGLVLLSLIFVLATPATTKEDLFNTIKSHFGDDFFLDTDQTNDDDEMEEMFAEYTNSTASITAATSADGAEVVTLKHFSQLCLQNLDTLVPGTIQYELAAADCGWKYDYLSSPAKKKEWKVYFYGEGWRPDILDLSGCPMYCPLSPKCRLRVTTRLSEIVDGDLVVIFQSEANELIQRVPQFGSKKQYKVLYWREAQLLGPSLPTQKQFDFEMGVHYYAGLINPNFIRRPVQYLSGAVFPYPPLEFVPFEQRKFALSIISHCKAGSQRDVYQAHLIALLGQEKVHRFGECGDRKLPGRSINHAAKLMSEYLFYFAFENTIQDGYVTEKLFFALNVPTVPIYYGALNVPNITVTPSFLRVSDYHSPKELALHLQYLSENREEYMKLHYWRTHPASFTKEYLEILQHRVAGPDELMFYKKRNFKRFPRTAQCCRLCDENFVKFATETRTHASLVSHYMTEDQIAKKFFKGKM